MIELGDKTLKHIFITEFHMFKKLEERLSMLSRVMEDIKKSQIEVLEKKMTSNDKNYILAGINNRLDIEEETITKLEGINNGNNSN